MIITGKKFSKPEMSRVINGDKVLAKEEEKSEKVRLDHLLVQKYPEYNRSILQSFVGRGFVRVNGKTVSKASAKLEGGEEISLEIPEDFKKRIMERPPVIFEDENVLVLEKPTGLLSMSKGGYCAEPTLEDYGLLVHRLDRDTSGVVILAKNPETQSYLRRQFQERKTHKTYYAVVVGTPKMDEALIDLPISRNLNRPTTFKVDPNGKEAKTFYRVLKRNEKYSLLELKPITGRTHQLRVHLKYIGTPILGDKVYGEESERLYLHAGELEITIPGVSETGGKEGKRKVFKAEMPKCFLEKLEK